MTRIAFFDDNKEILVGNVVDHIVDEKSWFCPEFHDLDKYPEIASFFNDILVDVEVEDEKLRDTMVFNYKQCAELYIKKKEKKLLSDKIRVEWTKIIVPLKLYLCIDIKWTIFNELDTIWYFTNLNLDTAKTQFFKKYYKKINEYAIAYTKLICKENIETHYLFHNSPDTYFLLKKQFECLTHGYPTYNENYWWLIWWLKEILRGLEAGKKGKKITTKFIPSYHYTRLWKTDFCEIVHEEYEGFNSMLNFVLFLSLFVWITPIIFITKWMYNVELSYGYDIYIIDKNSLNSEILKSGFGWLVINCFSRLSKWILNRVDESCKEMFQKLKNEYKTLWEEKSTVEEKLGKLSEYMASALKEYPKVDFHITTKHNQPQYIAIDVTQCDPKQFYSTEQSLWWNVDYENKILPGWKKKRIFHIKKNIKDI